MLDRTDSPLDRIVEEATQEHFDGDIPSAGHVAPKINAFAALGLDAALVKAVGSLGFTEPTKVQAKVIPLAMAERDASANDLMVSSQTGSGKTAAFLLPVLHALIQIEALRKQRKAQAAAAARAEAAAKGQALPKAPKRKNPFAHRPSGPAAPSALVLCPTRELAQQVANDAIDLVRDGAGCRVACVVGGMPYHQQRQRLDGAMLVVATPGRLLDLQRTGALRLDSIEVLVVDEADRMLDLGFADDLTAIHQLCAQRRQTMMFSATFAPNVMGLAARVMREPQRIAIDSQHERHANIQQNLYWADNAAHKRALLDHWMRDPAIEQAIIFASTQIECDALANDLIDAGFSATSLHGALNQGLRNRRLGALRDGRVQFLVATDVAARGIDVRTISHVFNFGLPMKAEDYVHRVGRTGRAGRDGIAITFAERFQRHKIFEIERFTQQSLQPAVIPGLEPRDPGPSGNKRGAPGKHGAGRPGRARPGASGHRPGGDRPKSFGSPNKPNRPRSR
jgi:superfamily II DNA/RNA helicase